MAEFFRPYDGVKRPRNGKRERLTVGAAAGGLTPGTYIVQAPIPASVNKVITSEIKPVYALVQVLAQPLNFTLDGTTPTAAVGYLAAANDLIHLNSLQEIQNFKAIRNGVSDATIEVTYFYGR